jgi:O-acetylserine/cysteine efflux transporter
MREVVATGCRVFGESARYDGDSAPARFETQIPSSLRRGTALATPGTGVSLKHSIAPRDLALTLAVVALWGFAFVPIKWALAEIPPLLLASLRFLFAAVPAVLLVRRPAMPLAPLIGYGVAIGVFQFGLLFIGMRLGMPAGLSSLVIQTQVFFTIGLAVAFAGDRLHRWNVFGALVAFAGIVVLGGYKVAAGAGATLAGFALVIASAFAWGVGNVIAKRAQGADMLALVVWSSLAPPLPLLALSALLEGNPWPPIAAASAQTWACILFLAWGATLFGFGSWNRLLHRYPTPLISPFGLLIPISGLASGALFLGERLAWAQGAGVALVFAGLVVNVYGPRMWRWLGARL